VDSTTVKVYAEPSKASNASVPKESNPREVPWFHIVPLAIATDRRYTSTDFKVFGTLYRLAKRRRKEVVISLAKLAELAGVSRSALWESLNKLKRARWIRVTVKGSRYAFRVRQPRGGYLHVPIELLEASRSLGIVYGFLRLGQGKKKSMRPNIAKLALLTGYSRRQIHTAIDKLAENVWIEKRGNRSNLSITVLDEISHVLKLAHKREKATTEIAESKTTTPPTETAVSPDFTPPVAGLHTDLPPDFTSPTEGDQFPSAKSDTPNSFLNTFFNKEISNRQAENLQLGGKGELPSQRLRDGPKASATPLGPEPKFPRARDSREILARFEAFARERVGETIDEITLRTRLIGELVAEAERLKEALAQAPSAEERAKIESELRAVQVEIEAHRRTLRLLRGEESNGLLIDENSFLGA